MNAHAQAPLPMTDLGRLLSEKDAQMNLTKLLRTLEDESLRVQRKMSQGLSQDDYAHASKRVSALDSAQLILKSLQIYLVH
jgi:hypothetical protein